MAGPCSGDLRSRVLAAVEAGESVTATARRFAVGRSTAYRFADLAAHKTSQVRALLDHSGSAYRYLPDCSPDLNPIEPAWAKVEAELRRVAARTADALHAACGPALDAVTAQDAAGFFRHCGYIRPG